MTTIPLIANPAAGGGRCGAKIDEAVKRLATGGVTVEVLRTNGPGHASALARRCWEEGKRTVLCAGGDGTTYEVVNGLFPHKGDVRPTLGILPLGTGNSFIKDFGIRSEDDAFRAVLSPSRKAVDVIRGDHTKGAIHFVNLLSVGFTSDVGATTNRRFKPLGPAGYAVATVLEVARLKSRSFPHTLDGGPVDAAPYVFLSFNNSRCTGGDMQMAPDANVSDGMLDVIRVGDLTRLELLTTFPKIYKGTHLEHPKNSSARAKVVEFDLPGPLGVMVDGEVLTLHLRKLTVLPSALEIMA
jgi:YegS/Rv2252/BmrU family lipid kinase